MLQTGSTELYYTPVNIQRQIYADGKQGTVIKKREKSQYKYSYKYLLKYGKS
jgi:hypothetical protein